MLSATRLSAMPGAIAIGFVLALGLSCSEPPPAPQVAPATSAGSKAAAAEVLAVEAQPAPQPAEPGGVERTSPLAVGDQAPDFRLQDQHGSHHTLAGLLQGGQVALVFYRSADW